jgi:hypothetical protein
MLLVSPSVKIEKNPPGVGGILILRALISLSTLAGPGETCFWEPLIPVLTPNECLWWRRNILVNGRIAPISMKKEGNFSKKAAFPGEIPAPKNQS